jgi:hypothetical protein
VRVIARHRDRPAAVLEEGAFAGVAGESGRRRVRRLRLGRSPEAAQQVGADGVVLRPNR